MMIDPRTFDHGTEQVRDAKNSLELVLFVHYGHAQDVVLAKQLQMRSPMFVDCAPLSSSTRVQSVLPATLRQRYYSLEC